MQAHLSASETCAVTTPSPTATHAGNWRFFLGMLALVLALVVPALTLIVPFLGLSTAASAAVVAILVVGVPEALLLLAAVLLGKQAVHSLLAHAKQMLWPTSSTCPPHQGGQSST